MKAHSDDIAARAAASKEYLCNIVEEAFQKYERNEWQVLVKALSKRAVVGDAVVAMVA